jgi:formylaminopyrimidine deformylase
MTGDTKMATKIDLKMDKKMKTAISASVESLRGELIQLVSDTVKIPSVNPTFGGVPAEQLGESRVNEFLRPIMESMGLKTDLWEQEKGRANLVGVCQGAGQGKSLIFNGHVDVVPPGAEALWTEAGPWSGAVKAGRIYGRGACDMKGGNAAALIALKALLKIGLRPQGDVILESVVGEEMMNTEAGTGATIVRGYKADGAIVVEPSAPPYRLAIITASPGALAMKITIQGKAAHSSMRDEIIRAGGRGSQVAVSAVDKGFLIYQGLLQLEQEWGQSKSHPAFARPGHFTLCPSVFMGGAQGIAYIPDDCVLEYLVWHAPQESQEQVQSEILAHIDRVAQTDPWLRQHPPQVEWILWWPPHDVPFEAPITQAVAAAYQDALAEPASLYGFAAVDDASFLNRAGIPAISIGPGNLNVAHAANEHVEIDELVDAAKIYACAIVEWCGV